NDEITGMVPSLPERFASLVGSDEAETPTPAKPERKEPAATTETTPVPVAVKAAVPAPEEKSPTPPAENKKAAVAEAKPAVTPETTTENASDTPQVASASGTDKVNDSKPETSTEMASSDPTMSEQTPVAKPAKTATAGTATAEKVATAATDAAAKASSSTIAQPVVSETAKPAMTDDLKAAAAMATVEGAAEGQAAENEDGTRVYGDPDGGSRVVIRAAEDSWVEVRDGEGELLLTRVLREGDRYYVPNRAGLTLVTGNAGALKFSVDGDEVAGIGPPGTVRRNVHLDPQALKDGTAHTR
ncbi:MAG: RodZ domain-containing protein, partial [Pseudomonadota bacterium]|nr:RodZ domain-containing protein [Pseudomonadota bacterium]